jgi:hypothetical protein
MTDLGDLLTLAPDLFPTAPRRRPRLPCANPTCPRLVYVDRAIFGFGEDCAEARGLIPHRWRLPRPDRRQTGPDLFTPPHPEVPMPDMPYIPFRRFRLDRDDQPPVEGIQFSDGTIVLHYPAVQETLAFDPDRVADQGLPESLAIAAPGGPHLIWIDPDPEPAPPGPPGTPAPQVAQRRPELAEPDLRGPLPPHPDAAA